MADRTIYRVLLADPPWRFGDSLPGKGRGAAKHYGCLGVSEIERFQLPLLAPDAVLVLWRVSAMVEEAYRVVRAWGFTPKTEIVWVKTLNGDPSRLRMGMGRSVRLCHETAILAVRGRPVRKSASELSVFHAPRTEHSAKPELVHELLERLYPGPYAELFARRPRPGWDCFGDEVGSD